MQATEILMSEHRVIERVIAALESTANQLDEGQPVRPGFFLDAAAFIQGFADGCHHRKEEGVLFKMLGDHGLPAQGGPVGVMLAEHAQARQITAALRSAAQNLQAGDASARPDVAHHARAYAALLRQHILKEDTILFPAADRVIPTELHSAVLEGFEHVEHEETGEGVHEKFLALAESLEVEAGLG